MIAIVGGFFRCTATFGITVTVLPHFIYFNDWPSLPFVTTMVSGQPNFAKHTSQEIPGALYRRRMPYHGQAKFQWTKSACSDGKLCRKKECKHSFVHIPIAPKPSLLLLPCLCLEESSVCIEPYYGTSLTNYFSLAPDFVIW